MISVFAHLLIYDSPWSHVKASIDSLLAQEGVEIRVVVSENGARSDTIAHVAYTYGDRVRIRKNSTNLGFSGGHNWAVRLFLESDSHFFLTVNPDLTLTPTALKTMLEAAGGNSSVGMVTPLLLRSDFNLAPISPAVIDAAGMVLTSSLRHFDRGSGATTSAKFSNREEVFGGTGACLLISKQCCEALLLQGEKFDSDLFRVYPELAMGYPERAPLFDEAFFAYREDADLSWRAQLLGWKCLFVGDAVGYHHRVVTPERRETLPAILNKLGVRNRFLLQINNYFTPSVYSILLGAILRNAVVLFGVMLSERSSLTAFSELWSLRKRATERRAILKSRIKVSPSIIQNWMKKGDQNN